MCKCSEIHSSQIDYFLCNSSRSITVITSVFPFCEIEFSFLKVHQQGQMHQKHALPQGAREFGGEQAKNAEYAIIIHFFL